MVDKDVRLEGQKASPGKSSLSVTINEAILTFLYNQGYRVGSKVGLSFIQRVEFQTNKRLYGHTMETKRLRAKLPGVKRTTKQCGPQERHVSSAQPRVWMFTHQKRPRRANPRWCFSHDKRYSD